jgi:hypothetical protein
MLKPPFNEAHQRAKFRYLHLSLRPQVLHEGSVQGGSGMVISVASRYSSVLLLASLIMVSVASAGGPPVYAPGPQCAPAPCGPPPQSCGPGFGNPLGLCGSILGACTSVCGFVIGIPAAVMGGFLAPPATYAPRMMSGQCGPPPVNSCMPPQMSCAPPTSCAPQACGPYNCAPPAITKCKPSSGACTF